MAGLGGIYRKYFDALGKASDKGVYKIYEKYAEKLQFDLKDIKGDDYWKVHGEAISYFGKIEFYESRETLALKLAVPGRATRFSQSIGRVMGLKDKGLLLSKYPERCPECGFHRFFGIRIEFHSAGDIIEYFCPSCAKNFEVVGSEGW